MNVSQLEGFEVAGFFVRTTNADEMNATNAKIGGLWERFYTEALPKLSESSKVYGLYTNYDSDVSGAYDVFACASNLSSDSLPQLISTKIESGKYLTFSAKGEMPQVVIDLWGEVWRYFDAEDCPHSRAYTTDFEFYKGHDEVEISIALK
ncbi:GyrI-like domain-containing protein [Vibrio nereis]|uniref:GyrI-like domain-containing protein n=1 Tax=Vibrio nereis TaxID=693 RepID=UPI00249467D7|nr:GyrI-like domain-containing protein [Vibrio nereis]